ncbi:ABC transporter permease [Gelria sp. Kuro-4]|uniref:ABC transporter permease n=1 Tax=Gelria sp. Kuro-4 TaxID=2796927 RepID=UPI001BEF35FF|nr:ABC transporter permease [Gelria sp. Kuro-4]BCV23609.1 ABC transporter permease [Gelria sp. Kuro-4]
MLNPKLFTPKEDIPRGLYTALGLACFFAILLVWSLLTYTGLVAPMFLPRPDQALRAGLALLQGGGLIADTGLSVFRVAAGFLLAALLGVPLGILMGTLKVFEGLFEPVIGFIRYLPASAFIPLFILWLGLGELEKIAVIFFGTFFQLTLMVMDATKNTPMDLIEVSYTLGAGRRDVFFKVILPYSLPGIVDTLRITFGWAWTYLVVAEIVGATSGLGFMIMQSSRFLKPERIIVGILVIGFLGIITDALFKLTYRLSFPWLGKEGR